jgi:amino-acid N-acetyltransferase
MKMRSAKITDAATIYSLINYYAEHDKMLFRSMANIYENLQCFTVAELAGKVVGCCALEVVWSDLAEVKSLAVDPEQTDKGIGKKLVETALRQAHQLGIQRVFALTLEPDFFQRLGFSKIEKRELPMKVWSDCARCPKQEHCDEVAIIKSVKPQA